MLAAKESPGLGTRGLSVPSLWFSSALAPTSFSSLQTSLTVGSFWILSPGFCRHFYVSL